MRNSYYIGMALQAMERAHEQNLDSSVGIHISQAIDALRELIQQNVVNRSSTDHPEVDRYEINDFNSAI